MILENELLQLALGMAQALAALKGNSTGPESIDTGVSVVKASK